MFSSQLKTTYNLPGHIGILSYEGKSSLRKEAIQAMIYHSGHEPLPLRSFKEGDYQMVKFKKEMTKGHFYNDHYDFYIDGEIYKDGVGLFLSCENEEDLLNSLKQIDGYFSATIFNKKKRQLHLVTDRYGMKPLYLFNQGKTTAWCSELKSLLSLDLSLSINVSNINLFLNSGFLPGNTTWYDHVELINPSTLVTIGLEGRSMDQHFYWKWAEKTMRPEWTLEEAISNIGELFDRSVSARLTESQLNMVGLSGGLDSRFIAQVLGNASSTCFTFGHKGSDDVRLARKVSSILDIHHEFLEYHHDNWLKGKIMSVWRTEGMLPFFHLHASPFMEALYQMGDTVFNGFGGATLMGGLFLGKESKLRRQIGSLTSSKIEFYDGGQPESLVIDQHMRRFIHQGSVDLGKYLVQRKPYMDHQLLDILLSLPQKFRKNYRLFHGLLRSRMNAKLLKVPWENTLMTIRSPQLNVAMQALRWPSIRRISKLGKPAFNYPLLANSTFKKHVSEEILGEEALIWKYLDNSQWNDHVLFKDMQKTGRLLSLEIWLRLSEGKISQHEDFTRL